MYPLDFIMKALKSFSEPVVTFKFATNLPCYIEEKILGTAVIGVSIAPRVEDTVIKDQRKEPDEGPNPNEEDEEDTVSESEEDPPTEDN